MILNEASRLTQLNSLDKIFNVLETNKVTFSAVMEDIREVISTMDPALASEAKDWYGIAHDFSRGIAATLNMPLETVVGVISAVSPRMPWQRNKVTAVRILAEYGSYAHLSPLEAAKVMGIGLNFNVAMAIKIARGAEVDNTLTGVKRRSFFNNIVAPMHSDSVTVDTWMARTLMNVMGWDLAKASGFLRANKMALLGTGVGYYLIAESIRTVAGEMNLVPSQVQAMYWIAVSGSIDGGRPDIS